MYEFWTHEHPKNYQKNRKYSPSHCSKIDNDYIAD